MIICIKLSKVLIGAQLRNLLGHVKHVPYHLKTDNKNLVYINCALTGKVVRWKFYMQDCAEDQEEHQQVPDKLSRLV